MGPSNRALNPVFCRGVFGVLKITSFKGRRYLGYVKLDHFPQKHRNKNITLRIMGSQNCFFFGGPNIEPQEVFRCL